MLYVPGLYKDNKERIEHEERKGKKEASKERETVKRDSCILFSSHRFGRLACYIDYMNLRITTIVRSSKRVFGKSVDIIIRTL